MDVNKLARAICSFFVPGLGQFMNGEIDKGLIFLIGFFVIWFVLLFSGIPYIHRIYGIVVRLFAAYDAYTYDGF